MCPRYFIIFHVYLTKSFNTILQFVLQFKMFHFKSQNISQYFTMFLEMFRNNWHICCLQMLEWSVTAGAGSVTPGGGSMSARTPQLPARFPLVPARCLLGAGLVPVARLPLVPARLPMVTGCRLGSRAFLDYPDQISSLPTNNSALTPENSACIQAMPPFHLDLTCACMSDPRAASPKSQLESVHSNDGMSFRRRPWINSIE